MNFSGCSVVIYQGNSNVAVLPPTLPDPELAGLDLYMFLADKNRLSLVLKTSCVCVYHGLK